MRRVVLVLIPTLLVALGLASGASATPVALQNATATFSQTGACTAAFPIGAAIDGDFGTTNGWAIARDGVCGLTNATTGETAAFETAVDQGFGGGTLFTFTLSQLFPDRGGNHQIGAFRLSYTTDARSNFADGASAGGDVTANWFEFTPLTAVASAAGTTLTIRADNSILAGGSTGPGTYTVTASTLAQSITGFRLEVLEDPAFAPSNGPGREPSNGNFLLTEFEVSADQLVGATAVPEPATLGLLASGLGLALGTLRRRRKL